MTPLVPTSSNNFAEDLFLLIKNRYGQDFNNRRQAVVALYAVHFCSSNDPEKLQRNFMIYHNSLNTLMRLMVAALYDRVPDYTRSQELVCELACLNLTDERFDAIWNAIAGVRLRSDKLEVLVALPNVDPNVQAFLNTYGKEKVDGPGSE